VNSEIKLFPGNGPYYGQTYYLFSPLYPNNTNKSGHSKMDIFDFAEEMTESFKTNEIKGVWPKRSND
jgi:hypothetical protein